MVFTSIRGSSFFILMRMCIDNWTLKPVCVSTIGDTIDCQDTYVKIRVFSYFLRIFHYIWSCEDKFNQFVTGHIKNPVKNWTDTRVTM